MIGLLLLLIAGHISYGRVLLIALNYRRVEVVVTRYRVFALHDGMLLLLLLLLLDEVLLMVQ